jgi:hypothetical protein
MSDDRPNLLIDPSRSCCLCDVGGAGLGAVYAIDENGDEYLVVADLAALDDPAAQRFDAAARDAPHEHGHGPLDEATWMRVWGSP